MCPRGHWGDVLERWSWRFSDEGLTKTRRHASVACHDLSQSKKQRQTQVHTIAGGHEQEKAYWTCQATRAKRNRKLAPRAGALRRPAMRFKRHEANLSLAIASSTTTVPLRHRSRSHSLGHDRFRFRSRELHRVAPTSVGFVLSAALNATHSVLHAGTACECTHRRVALLGVAIETRTETTAAIVSDRFRSAPARARLRAYEAKF